MPKIFPYNRYTLSVSDPLHVYFLHSHKFSQKLIKRLIWKDHIAILTERQNELLAELAELTKEGFAKAQEEWEKSVAVWGM